MTTYSITMHGTCPAPDCGITVTASGSGIPEEQRPDDKHRLGDAIKGLVCICGTDVEDARVVGLTIDPFTATVDIDDEPAVDGEIAELER